jgi:hypothetical protein
LVLGLVFLLGGSALASSDGAGGWTTWLSLLGSDEVVETPDDTTVSTEPEGTGDDGSTQDTGEEPGDEGDPVDEDPADDGTTDDAVDPEDGEDPAEDPAGEEGLFLEGDGFTLLVELTKITLTLAAGEDGAVEPLEIPLARTNNHGAYVSALAQAAPKGPGHGSIVSLLATSPVGKPGWLDGDMPEDQDPEEPAEEPEDIDEDAPADPAGTDPEGEESLDTSEALVGAAAAANGAELKKGPPSGSKKPAVSKSSVGKKAAGKAAAAGGKRGKK